MTLISFVMGVFVDDVWMTVRWINDRVFVWLRVNEASCTRSYLPYEIPCCFVCACRVSRSRRRGRCDFVFKIIYYIRVTIQRACKTKCLDEILIASMQFSRMRWKFLAKRLREFHRSVRAFKQFVFYTIFFVTIRNMWSVQCDDHVHLLNCIKTCDVFRWLDMKMLVLQIHR